MTVKNGISPFQVKPGTQLLGEIITWSCSGVNIDYVHLIDALRDVGLEESVARELAPRHAFSRACKKLSEARIISCTFRGQPPKYNKLLLKWQYC